MKIVIVGSGAVGYQIASQLIHEDKDVIIIEKNPERAKFVNNNLDCYVVVGSGTSREDLIEAGIKDADIFISVTNSDEVNMISCGLVSSEFDVPTKIARIRNIQYTGAKIISDKFLGIDYIVNPETEAAEQIIKTIKSGALSDILSFEKIEVQIRSIHIMNHPKLAGKTLREIRQAIDEQFIIAAIARDKEILIPHGNTQILSNDTILIVAENDTFGKIFKKIGKTGKKIEKVLIVGGGQIGLSVVERLISNKELKISLIERSYERCKYISEIHPEILVLNSDIRNEKLFEEENFANYDLIITMTNNEELNILSAIYAKRLGIKRAIALILNNNYSNLSTQLGIDSAVSPKLSSVNSILKYIRKGNISSVYSIYDGKAEIIEYIISKNNKFRTKKVKDIPMPDHSLIIGISRDNKNIIPDGNFELYENDVVLTIVAKKSITKIEKLFNN